MIPLHIKTVDGKPPTREQVEKLMAHLQKHLDKTEKPDPIVMSVTARCLFDQGYWIEACQLTGINEWAVRDGLMEYDDKVDLTESQARELGFIK